MSPLLQLYLEHHDNNAVVRVLEPRPKYFLQSHRSIDDQLEYFFQKNRNVSDFYSFIRNIEGTKGSLLFGHRPNQLEPHEMAILIAVPQIQTYDIRVQKSKDIASNSKSHCEFNVGKRTYPTPKSLVGGYTSNPFHKSSTFLGNTSRQPNELK